MKKIFQIITLFAAAAFWACSDFNDSELRQRIENAQDRIEALKAKAESISAQMADLSYLTNGNVITSVSQDAEGKYVVTYKDNADKVRTVVLATLSDMIDVPIVGVQLGEDDIFYWTQTVDGQTTWLTDADGNRFPVSGYTPTISVDQDGYWTIDGERVIDAAGNPVKATDAASSVLRAAAIDADGNLQLTLGNGTTFTLPVFNTLNLKLDSTPVTMVADAERPMSIGYSLSGEAAKSAIVAVAKAEGVEAVLNTEKQTVDITFGAGFKQGTVIVMAYDLADNVVIRPLFFRTSILGTIVISTAEELVNFAAAVNAGGEEASAKVVLGADIDMKGVAWTPIGNDSYTTTERKTANFFKGTFEGKGYKITNLTVTVPADAAAGTAWGLFGVLDGATVSDVVIGEGSSMSSTATALTALGGVAGYIYDGVMENCENHAAIHFAGGTDNVRELVGGVVGGIYTADADCVVTGCKNYGRITSTNTVNTKNGATGFSVGGIVGFADALNTPETRCRVENCVNEGAIEAQATRTAGIVATMNKCTEVKGCVNNAKVVCTDTKASNSRVGGIASALGAQTSIVNCVNNGDVAFAVAGDTTHGYAAGIAGQTNDGACLIDGCENYGTILSDIINAATNKYIAVICANTNKKTITISNCKIGGKIGPYSGGAEGATAITADNFAQYIYFSLAGAEPTLENNTFAEGSVVTPTQKGISSAEDLMALRDAVNRRESTAPWENEEGVICLLKDIDLSAAGAWTPIGTDSYTTVARADANFFKGTFDGCGYKITNLTVTVPADAATGTAWGLFGVLDAATVRNLTIGEGSSMTSTATELTALGGVAGYVYDGLVENCENYASIHFAGGTDNIRELVGGVVGGIYTADADCLVTGSKNYGRITSVNTVNTKNGATGFSVGGIVGFADGLSDVTTRARVENCVNEGVVETQATRTAGIVATLNKYSAVKGCVNNGAVICTDTKASSSRVAGITAGMGAQTSVIDCVNNGDISFAVAGDTTHGLVAGIAGQTNDNSCVIDGCENYGTILSDIINAASNKYIATICANTNKKSIALRNCKIGGKIGPYSGGAEGATEITADNFTQYIYFSQAGTTPVLDNNTFGGGATPSQKGISSAEDLMAFRDAVNRGESTAEWENDEGVICLLKDIDLAAAGEWTPIGNAKAAWANGSFTVSDGNAFKGTFDGGGHALRNVKLAYAGGDANGVYGLFGVLDGATVRNLTIGAPAARSEADASEFKVTATGGTAETGVVAGICRDATISEVTNYAPIIYDGTSAARVSVAMVGMAYGEKTGTTLEQLKNYGPVTANTHGNSTNGLGTAIHVAGICGVGSGNTTNKICNKFSYCDNYADITSDAARTSGIVAAANSYTVLNSCVNHGNQLNTCGSTGRQGNITCITGGGVSLIDCINNGNLVCTAGSRAGGLICLVNNVTNSFSGCANYGEIITNDTNRGVFFAYCAYTTTWINCIAGGKVGVYNGGQYIYDEYSEANQERYMGVQKSGSPINADNITYLIGTSGGGSGSGDQVEPTLRILFIGNSFTKDAVEHLPKLVNAAGIKTLKMTHLYYGGRTIPEYADGYATRSDYTCYKYMPSTSVWLSYSGYTIQQIVKEEPWDIVCIQEHTGNKAGWVWDATEKGAIQSLLASIKADNAKTPRFAYIMSQAYFNMDKIGSGSRPYMTWTTQSGMFDVIVAQAKKVLAETDVETIIPTGTVLQNLRTSSLNNAMDLTRDGYHMDYGLSRYAASCAVFEMLVGPAFGGVKLDGNTFRYDVSNTADGSYTTPVTDASAPVALQAARYAIENPFAVTNMSAAPSKPDNGIEDTDFENSTDKE